MNNAPAALQRYVPLACWVAVLLTVLLISLKIIGYGFVPAGDARRHVAKPFANKPYSEIVVMRPEYVVDHSPGWEWLLGVLHRALGWSEDNLMSFSIVSTLLWVFCLPLVWLRRPEAWLAALLALLIAEPQVMPRLTQARPYLISYGVVAALFLAWSREDGQRPSWLKLCLTFAGMTLAIWMHGVWYLWALPAAAFFLAGRWRDGLRLAACWLAGALAAGLLTGKPLAFLSEAVFIAGLIYREHLPKFMLVGEFQPSAGEVGALTLLALVYLWLKLQNKLRVPLFRQPVFWMIVLNWILGLFAARFWADWAIPAVLAWLAMQFDEALPGIAAETALKRLLVCGLIAAPLFLDATNDLERRYTFSQDETFLQADDPALAGWLPGKNGIAYADNMTFFYDTFYKNPTADWRYIAGFEPALMPPEDLKVYRAIRAGNQAPQEYEPWIKKMRPQDRLVTARAYEPPLPGLQWHRFGKFWIGRLPQNPSPAVKP